MKKLWSILLALSILTLCGCSSAVKTERHYEKTVTENDKTSSYEKTETTYKDESKVKITVEGYDDGYINVSVKCKLNDGCDAWIGLCPESSNYETAKGANESAVLKESITSDNQNFTFNLKGMRKGEYRIVAVLDSYNDDAKSYTSDLFAFDWWICGKQSFPLFVC